MVTLQSLLKQLYSVCRVPSLVNKPVVAGESGSTLADGVLPVGAVHETEEDGGIWNLVEPDEDAVKGMRGSVPAMKGCMEEEEHCFPSPSECEMDGTLGADVTPEQFQEMESERVSSEGESLHTFPLSPEDEECCVGAEEDEQEAELRTGTTQASLSQWSRGSCAGISKQVELFLVASNACM